ncbi:MAG TPA: ABC transporter permease [Terriglobales bacterium]|nr:ABC transporter permease [Terriglobales bacterium]
MESLLQDIRFAVRTLLKTPAFTAVAVITLALGIGGNTAIFSAAEGIWLRPLPWTDISRLVAIGQQTRESDSRWAAAATYREWRERSQSFSAISAYVDSTANLGGRSTTTGSPQHVQQVAVDQGFFALMDMKPALGRVFSADDFQPERNVVILSDALWQGQFGGRSDVVGETIQLDGKPYTIVGVMAKDQDYPAATDIWLPLGFSAQDWSDTKQHRVYVLARLRPGVTRAQAAGELDGLLHGLAARSPQDYESLRAAVYPLGEVINGNLTPGFLRVLLGAAGFVLLIACINLGNLQLARATARRKEFSLRAALGCGRGRLARQLMTESMVLALAGAAVGLLIAYWAVQWMVSSMPPDTARQISGWTQMNIDARVFLFTIAAAVVSGVLAGLVPVARGYKFAPGEALKAGGTTTQSAPHRLRAILVVGEAAVALMLLVGTILVVQGFRHMLAAAGEFDPSSLMTMQVELSSAKYATAAAKANFYSQALESLRAIPGVTAAATFSSVPYSNNGVEWRSFRTPSMAAAVGRPPSAIVQSVSPEFFRALNIPLFSGRAFADSDSPDALPVAIISDVLARRYFPGQSPVGQSLLLLEAGRPRPSENGPGPRETALTIIGISGNVEYDWTNNQAEPVIYVPFRQRPQTTAFLAVRSATCVARVSDPCSLVPAIRERVAQLDPALPLSNMKTLDRLLLESLAGLFQIGGLMSSFGLLALLLSAAGIYGMVSYTVSQRTHEIGIRMAIGAEHLDVLRMILMQTMRFALIGAGLGLVGAIALGRVIRGFFYGASATSALPFLFAFVVLVGAALLASIGPARKATRVDPMIALRTE